MKERIYIKPELQKTINKKTVEIGDICEVECRNKVMKQQVLKQQLYVFSDTKERKVYKKVFSVLDVIQILERILPEENFICIGATDFLVEYQPGPPPNKYITRIKIIVICILIFFGSAFTIMAFNNDISIDGVFEHFYYQMTGRPKPQFSELEVAYSIGLAVGIIVFFNHLGKRKLTDDVTPIEVEINKHKQDTYDTIIEKSNHSNE